MIIDNAYAQDAAQQSLTFANFVPFIAIFVIFYFLLIRPQQKKIKEHQNLINNLKNGDKVVTNAGIIGKITKISSDNILAKISIADNVEIEIQKNSIVELYNKG